MTSAFTNQSVSAVIFDLDDTLVSASRVKWDHFKAVAQECYGLSLDDKSLRMQWGKPLLHQVQELFGSIDRPDGVYANLTAADHRFPKLAFPGAVEAVDQLLESGTHVGVVTSGPSFYAVDDLQRLGFSPHRLAFVNGEEDVEFHKPDPRVFNPGIEVLRDFGVDRGEIVYIGDLVTDFVAATSAGLKFIGVTTGVASPDELRTGGAEIVVPDVAKAIELLTAACDAVRRD